MKTTALLIATVIIAVRMFGLERWIGPLGLWIEQNFLALMLTLMIPLLAPILK